MQGPKFISQRKSLFDQQIDEGDWYEFPSWLEANKVEVATPLNVFLLLHHMLHHNMTPLKEIRI